MSHYLETPDGRRPFIRSRAALQTATEFVEWWPLEDHPMAANLVQRYLGLNEIEIEDVRRRAYLFSVNCDIDQSDASFDRRFNIIQAAQDIVGVSPEDGWLIAPAIIARYRFLDDPDAVERVTELVLFFWEHPPKWLEARWAVLRAREEAGLAAAPS